MLAYVFPGQGSQEKGMGGDLFDLFPEETAQADAILGYSIKQLCLSDPNQLLQITTYTQPAIYIVNALHYLNTKQTCCRPPDYVAGHSLGEYNALFAAGVFDFSTGLSLVKKRSELMHAATDGAMAAILGLVHDDLHQILVNNQFHTLSIANHNSYTQFVISGPRHEVHRLNLILDKITNATFIPLKVSGAFHSSLMSDAKMHFIDFLTQYRFLTPQMPVLANINAQPYHPAVIQSNLANQIDQPVQWIKTMENLLQYENACIEEIGHAKILSGLLRRIKNSI